MSVTVLKSNLLPPSRAAFVSYVLTKSNNQQTVLTPKQASKFLQCLNVSSSSLPCSNSPVLQLPNCTLTFSFNGKSYRKALSQFHQNKVHLSDVFAQLLAQKYPSSKSPDLLYQQATKSAGSVDTVIANYAKLAR